MSNEGSAIARRRGKWSKAHVPHRGWTCISEYDATEAIGDLITCEMCESMDVRFVHVMLNERYPDRLHCGCVCAAHMSGEKKEAVERDKRMRSRARRRAQFHKRGGWQTSRHGTPHIEVNGVHLVVARKGDGQFQVGAKGPREVEYRWGKKRYSTVQAAMTGCFDALEHVEREADATRVAVWNP
jgi:hypothetical protein